MLDVSVLIDTRLSDRCVGTVKHMLRFTQSDFAAGYAG